MTTLRIALAQLNITVGDLEGNRQKVLEAARNSDADLIIFPEMALTGYPPEDLVFKQQFQQEAKKAVKSLAIELIDAPAVLVGGLWEENGRIYNVAFLLEKGGIAHIQLKHDLPNYGVFDEKRVFSPGPLPRPYDFHGTKLGIMVCEDMWHPDVAAALKGSDILISINASPFEIGKRDLRRQRARSAVKRACAPLVYVNLMCGQDDLVFDGDSFILDGEGREVAHLPEWEEKVTGYQLPVASDIIFSPLSEADTIYQALMRGLKDYVEKNGFPGVVLGLSGGIDSALSAAVAVDALGAERVWAVMMPSRYTSQESVNDAAECARLLGIKLNTISIEDTLQQVEHGLMPLFSGMMRDLTEENVQSRLRGLLLMALSNKFGPMVLSTGNKSEYAVGYATLYGDMCGGYNVLKDVYKTLVYRLANWRNHHVPKHGLGLKRRVIPENIIVRAPTAELRENQKDEDSLPPYDILDPVLHMLIEEEAGVEEVIAAGYEREIVESVARMLYRAEYKRRQSPPGVKISPKYFGRDRRYPMTNKFEGI